MLITRGMVGRLSNTSNVIFAYEILGVVDYLTSHGFRALPGRRYSTAEVQGKDWVIQPTQVTMPMQPSEVRSRNLLDGGISISFNNYKAAPSSSRINYNVEDEEIFSDEEEIRSHTIAVILQEADDEEDEVEILHNNLNGYFQDNYAFKRGKEEEYDMPYPQKQKEEIIAVGMEENWETEYPQLAKLS